MTDGYDWRPIETYNDEAFSLFRNAAGKLVFGERQGCAWYELLDGELYLVAGFIPVEWAIVPEERWDAWASG